MVRMYNLTGKKLFGSLKKKEFVEEKNYIFFCEKLVSERAKGVVRLSNSLQLTNRAPSYPSLCRLRLKRTHPVYCSMNSSAMKLYA